MKSQSAADTTMSDDLGSVARACKRIAKRAKKTSQCGDPSTTLSAAAFLAFLAKRGDIKKSL